MHEFLQIMGGIATCLMLEAGSGNPPRAVGLAMAIVLGFVAGVLGGALEVSWVYLVVGVPLVRFSSAMGLLPDRLIQAFPTAFNEPLGLHQRFGR